MTTQPAHHRDGVCFLVIVCRLHDEGLRVIEPLLLAGVGVVVIDDLPDPRHVTAPRGLGSI